MIKDSIPATSIEGLIKSLGGTSNQKSAPVHLWDPPFCGDLDMVIQENGRWEYNKSPMGREKLVRLFASVLKKEQDKYYLVTPVEKIGITVIDVPFIAIAMERHGEGVDQTLLFTTNVEDQVVAGSGHELRFKKSPDGESLKPYIHIRSGLEARLSRPVYYELANLVENHTVDGIEHLGVWSQGQFFPIDVFKTEM